MRLTARPADRRSGGDSASPPARRARALLLAVVAVGLAVGLRPDSDGALPGPLVLAGCVLAVALAALPLTGREHRLSALLAVLSSSQLAVTAVLLVAARGSAARPGATAWVCCPPAPAADQGLLSSPTAHGGLLLVAAQLLVAVLLAAWLRGLESAAWASARRLLVAALALLPRLAALLGLLRGAPLAPVPAPTSSRPRSDAPRPRAVLLARSHPRRGPPRAPYLRQHTVRIPAAALATAP